MSAELVQGESNVDNKMWT